MARIGHAEAMKQKKRQESRARSRHAKTLTASILQAGHLINTAPENATDNFASSPVHAVPSAPPPSPMEPEKAGEEAKDPSKDVEEEEDIIVLEFGGDDDDDNTPASEKGRKKRSMVPSMTMQTGAQGPRLTQDGELDELALLMLPEMPSTSEERDSGDGDLIIPERSSSDFYDDYDDIFYGDDDDDGPSSEGPVPYLDQLTSMEVGVWPYFHFFCKRIPLVPSPASQHVDIAIPLHCPFKVTGQLSDVLN